MLFRELPIVHHDERATGTPTLIVKSTSQHLLADARLSGQQNRLIAVSVRPDEGPTPLRSCADAD
jgi:hypothetical protein